MRRFLAVAAVVAALAVPAISQAALSGNLFDGNFENVAALKNNYTYDNSNNPVGAHRFNADGPDFGKWIGIWGLQDLEQNGYYGQGGFSTHDYPRDGTPTMQGVPGVVADDISNNNRSLDPYNPGSGNHIMETVAFYPTMAQWVQAPANQATGPMQLSFDFFLNHWWAGGSWDYFDRFQITVYGTNYLPPHNVGMGTDIPGTTFDGFNPTDGALSVDTTIDGVHYKGAMLARYGLGNWWSNDSGYPGTNGWKNRTSTNGAAWTEGVDVADQGSLIIPVNLTETFPYYSVVVSTGIYGEGHEYFWAVGGYGVNGYNATDLGPAIGFDNIDFQVSVASAVLRGDVNLDGLVNALDISPFVSRLTSGLYQAEADINVDMLVNALDISGFVTCLVNGACAPVAGSAAVPEPASLVLLGLSALALVRRR